MRRIEICSWLADWRYLHCTLLSFLTLKRKLDLLEAAKLQQKWEANLLSSVCGFSPPISALKLVLVKVASDDAACVLEVTTHFNPLPPWHVHVKLERNFAPCYMAAGRFTTQFYIHSLHYTLFMVFKERTNETPPGTGWLHWLRNLCGMRSTSP